MVQFLSLKIQQPAPYACDPENTSNKALLLILCHPPTKGLWSRPSCNGCWDMCRHQRECKRSNCRSAIWLPHFCTKLHRGKFIGSAHEVFSLQGFSGNSRWRFVSVWEDVLAFVIQARVITVSATYKLLYPDDSLGQCNIQLLTSKDIGCLVVRTSL